VKPQDAWKAAYNQLELQLDRASFDTWLRKAVFLGVEDGTFVIGVHNSYARDMLQHRLYRNIRRVLSDVRGESTELEFKIHKKETRTSPGALFGSDIGTSKKDSNPSGSGDDAPPLFKFLAQQEKTPDLPETSESGMQPPAQPSTAASLHGFVQRPQRPDLPESELNPRFNFKRFMVNKSNQVVYEAALAVAETPAAMYNPFLIYGGVGLGKTHLLQSIAHICQQKDLRTIYIPSEVFTNDLVSAIRNRTTAMFREKYRSADVLLVDDIQFISGKDTTQEEFFHTFNALVNFNKQIVLASDRHPREMQTLEARLRSRFQGGLVADIQPPEFETRVAILQMWAQERSADVSREVIHTVAERAPGNVRELAGMFNNILAQARLGKTISVPKATQTVEAFGQPRERVTLEHIIEVTAKKQGFTARDLRGKRRTSRVNRARQIAMYLSREMTEYSLPQIGKIFGGRSHTTVLHGANKIAEAIEADKLLAARVLRIRRAIVDSSN
jgi:chromosomal replication initiator protein